MTPLHQFGEFLRQALGQVPLGMVRVLFLLIIAALLLWVLSLPNTKVQPLEGESSGRADHLKWWAALALLIQLVIYALI